MLWLSEVLLQNQHIEYFDDLKNVVSERGKQGERFFKMDIKPPYMDTPADWEDQLEAAFTSVR
ncbi:MAG: sulfur relay protein DsrC [Gammaproteobacteria bacterium]|nr:sulfur relay protein DsrC [Gammaproteobacteria bacterium]